jgi:exopolysaccharide biosynthesis polyprenyl glycosylphosphotransferase
VAIPQNHYRITAMALANFTAQSNVRKVQLATCLLDWVGLIAAFNIAYKTRLGSYRADYLLQYDLIYIGVLMTLVFYIFFLYTPNTKVIGLKRPVRVWLATAALGVLIAMELYLFSRSAAQQYGRGVLLGALFIFASWSSLIRIWIDRIDLSVVNRVRWLVIGDLNYLEQLWADHQRSGLDSGLQFLTPDGKTHEDLPIGGSYQHLDQWLDRKWTGIVLATDYELPSEMTEKLLDARIKGTRIYDMTDFYSEIWQKVPVLFLNRSWLVMTEGFRLLHNPIGLRIKRVMDILLSVMLLPIALPLVVVAAIAIYFETGLPILFRQKRTGLHGDEFTLVKLRTMVQDAEKDGAQWAKVNDSRITKLGNFLRKSRIDELPQIFNVLKGDMSFIGPRPERPEFNKDLEKIIPHYSLRHIVRPGITGWAQTLYRYGSSTEDARKKLEYDLYYIKSYSIWMDLVVVIRTVRTMLFGAGR